MKQSNIVLIIYIIGIIIGVLGAIITMGLLSDIYIDVRIGETKEMHYENNN